MTTPAHPSGWSDGARSAGRGKSAPIFGSQCASDPDATSVTPGGGRADGRLPDGTELGHFTLKRMIGSGGMGRVYEAMQHNPRRTVAIKVMNRGMASRSALRRFEFEAQLLARLKHPGIAQIHEVGTHDDGTGGVPWFAMEYIGNAKSLTDYARDAKLRTRQRVQLFRQACEAVAHGHQRGVIHRDLKPGNLLVDGSGQLKVIDFGVARTTDSDMAVTTMQTDVGQLIGTVQYMSPEQFDADPHDLDIRSDVYALGVVLYELLTGQLPYELRRKAIHEAARIVREEEPPRPSTVTPTLRGDLESIVIKAMSKDRSRRYGSASELSEDLGRWLEGEPVSARAPGVLATLRSLARRRRAAAAATVGAVATLVVATMAVVPTLASAKGDRVALEQERLRAQGFLDEANARAESLAQQRQVAEQAVGALQAETYVGSIRRAAAALQSGRLVNVAQELDAIRAMRMPGADARFEMRWLTAALHPEALAIDTGAHDGVALAASPDGRTLASGGADGTVRLWDADTGRAIAALQGHTGRVNALAFSGDGRTLASASDDATIRLWNPGTAQAAEACLGTMRGHAGPVRTVAFSIDGRTLASGGADRSVRLWNTLSQTCTDTLQGHTQAVRCVAFLPDGRVASGSGDRSVRVWDVADATQHQVWPDHADAIAALATDGTSVYAGLADGSVNAHDLHDGTARWSASTGSCVNALAVQPSGTLAVANAHGVSMLAVHDGSNLPSPAGCRQPAAGLARAGASRLFTAGTDGVLRAWDGAPAAAATRASHADAPVQALAFTNDASQRLVAGALRGAVELRDPCTGRVMGSLQGVPAEARAIGCSNDGTLLAIAAPGGAIGTWDARTGARTGELPTPGTEVLALTISPDHRTLAGACEDGSVRLWDLSSGREFARLGQGVPAMAIAFSNDGTQLASAGADGRVRLWDPASRKELASPGGHDAAVRALRFSPDGHTLASASDDRTLRLWNLQAPAESRTLRGHDGAVTDVTFDPTGHTLASTGRDATVRLWNVDTAKELAVIEPGTGAVQSLAFHPAGHALALGGNDGDVKLLHAQSRAQMLARTPKAQTPALASTAEDR